MKTLLTTITLLTAMAAATGCTTSGKSMGPSPSVRHERVQEYLELHQRTPSGRFYEMP